MGFLDRRSFPFDHADGKALRDMLSELYEPSRAKSLCQDAGLPTARIDWNGSADKVWREVLRAAANSGRLRALADIIMADPESVAARPLLARLLAEPEGEAPPGRPSLPPSPRKPLILSPAPGPLTDAAPADRLARQPARSAFVKRERPLTGHRGWITSLCFSPDGTKLASAGEFGQLLLWDLTAAEPEPMRLPGHAGVVHGVAFSPDGSLLASAGADHVVQVRAVARPWHIIRRLTDHTNAVLSVAFSPDGSLLASGGADGTVRMCDLSAKGDQLRPVGRHADDASRVMFNKAGSLLASAGADRAVRLWKVPGGGLQRTLNAHSARVSGIAFTPDGTQLVSADWIKHSLIVWNLETGGQDRSITTAPCECGQVDWVPDIAFGPGGVLASAGCCDGSIRLWEIASGSMIGQLTGHDGPVSALAFSRDGKLLASGGGLDHDVRIWSE